MQISKPTIVGAVILTCALSLHPRLHGYDLVEQQDGQATECTEWLKSEVPESVVPDPTEICDHSKTGRIMSWESYALCPSPSSSARDRRFYCASSGTDGESTVLIVAYRALSSDGHELLDENRPESDTQLGSAMVYTNSQVRLDVLTLSPGFYIVSPLHSSEGWRLKVIRSTSDHFSENARGFVGSVPMKVEKNAEPEDRAKVLLLSDSTPNSDAAAACKEHGQPDHDARCFRLHLRWGATDASVSIFTDLPPSR